MYLIGGGRYEDRDCFNDVWSTADGINWRRDTANAPWDARQYHNVAEFDNKLWILGGWNVRAGNHSDTWYSTDGATWTRLEDTPWPARHAASVFTYANALWLVSGNNLKSDVWKLTKP